MARILIIDDNDDLRRMFRTALETVGHVVFDAPDGDLGLASFRDEPVEIVLCDIFMPGKEGLDTIRELSRLRPTPSIIAISGGSDIIQGDFLHAAQLLGAKHTLQKPFSMADLQRIIKQLLAERESASG